MNKYRLPIIVGIIIVICAFLFVFILSLSNKSLIKNNIFAKKSLLDFNFTIKPTTIREIGDVTGLPINRMDKSIISFSYKNNSKTDLTHVKLNMAFYVDGSNTPISNYFGIIPISVIQFDRGGLISNSFVTDLPDIKSGESKSFDDIFFFGRKTGKGIIKAIMSTDQGIFSSVASDNITISGLNSTANITSDSVFLTSGVTAKIGAGDPTAPLEEGKRSVEVKTASNGLNLDKTNRAELNYVIKNNTQSQLKNMKVKLNLPGKVNFEVVDTQTAKLDKNESKSGNMVFDVADVNAKSFSIYHIFLYSNTQRQDTVKSQITNGKEINLNLNPVEVTIK